MSTATITKATVFEDSGISLLARIVGQDGANITIASITAITCKIFNTRTKVELSTPAVVVADSVFDLLQTDSRWSADLTGYNFRHDLLATALAAGNGLYRVEYKFAPVVGENFHVLFDVATIDLMGS